jgi:microcystin degradation protein MlrC
VARIGIGGLHHETNSFAPQPASFARFVEADGWPPLLRGAAMLPGTAGINLAITGFVAAA